MGDTYILTEQQAGAYLKQALNNCYHSCSLFQMVSEHCRNDGTCTEDDVCGMVDRIMSDVARVVVMPWREREYFIPTTKEYPHMVYRELAKRIVSSSDYEEEHRTCVRLRYNTWHLADKYNKGWYHVCWDAHPLHSLYQEASNIVSCGWGNDVYCLHPDMAAELFLMLDDMTGYIREEARKIYYKVRQEIMCRQVEMNSVLAAVKEAGFKYYRLWVNSTRTIALHVKLSGCREIDITLYTRQINGMLDVLIEDLKAAERGEPTVLRCRIYDAVGSWDVIQ